MVFTPGSSRSTAPKDKGLVGWVREITDLVGLAAPACPAARDDPKSGREEGAWAAEVQVEEADVPVVVPHRGCVGKVRTGRGAQFTSR